MELEFGMKFKIGQEGADPRELVERLADAGCDGAVIGTGKPGRIALEFAREARSAKEAIVSALRDVKRAIPDAELIGVSRQNMRKLMLSHPDTFPAPVHEGSTSVWHLADVLQWLADRGDYAIEKPLLDVARVAMQINLAKEARALEAPVQKKVRALVA